MIGTILSFLVLAIVCLYIFAGIYSFPKLIYDTITHPGDYSSTSILSSTAITIAILLVLIAIAYFLSKNDYYYDYKSTVQKFLIISIPIYYGFALLFSYLFKDNETFNVLLFKKEQGIFINVLLIAMYHSMCSCYPVLISSFVFKYFSEKEFVKESRARREIESEEKKKKQQAERANQQIEYYKKLGDLEQLLKQETITKEKFNELKNSLDNQYNIK